MLTFPFQCCILPNFISSKSAESDGRSAAESNSGSGFPNTQASDFETNAVTNSGTSSLVGPGFGTSSSSVAGSGSETDGGEQNIGNAQDGVFLKDLVTELLMLKFYEKNNDLYQFHQVRGLYQAQWNIPYPDGFQAVHKGGSTVIFITVMFHCNEYHSGTSLIVDESLVHKGGSIVILIIY